MSSSPVCRPPPGLSRKYRSPASKRRDNARALAKQKYREGVQRHGSLLAIEELWNFALSSQLEFSVYIRRSLLPKASPGKGRQRDLLPLPLLHEVPPGVDIPSDTCDILIKFTNLTLCAVNFLASGCRSAATAAIPSSLASKAQAAARLNICEKVARLLSRLVKTYVLPDGSPSLFERVWETKAGASFPNLVADLVDIPASAGTCDAMNMISEDLHDRIDSGIFPSGATACPRPRFFAGAWTEYVKLTAYQLQCGKLALRTKIRAGGGIFVVPKSNGRLREVWNGSVISGLAESPPAPRRFPTPASLLDLRVPPGAHLFYSKRDAETFFDTLQAPTNLWDFFGRPGIQAKELADALGLDVRTLAATYLDSLDSAGNFLEEDKILHPVGTTWPMGFSWSSAVAQDVSLQCCVRAGLAEESILCDAHPVPPGLCEAVTVCTDDTLFFHLDPELGKARLDAFDNVQQACRIPQKNEKSLDLVSSMTGLGCDFSNAPARVEAAVDKVASILQGMVGVLRDPKASPKAVHGMLGVIQWIDLLARPTLSVFDCVYDFVRQSPGNEKRTVDNATLNELVISTALLPFLSSSFERDFLPLLIASDASTTFGYGLSVCPCSMQVAEQIAGLAEKRGDYIRLTRDDDDAAELPRIGRPHRLPVAMDNFKDVLSIRARLKAHASILETEAIVLAVKWILRSASRQQKRLVLFVDSKCALGAAAKGRSSSPGLLYVLRQLAAYVLAGDLLVRYVYIPSESNPADMASRGKRRRGTKRPSVSHSAEHLLSKPRWRRQLDEQIELYERILEIEEAYAHPFAEASEKNRY